MTWLIIIIIVGVIIFYFLRDRDKMLAIQVDNEGGIKKKYEELVNWLTDDPNAKITKLTRDHIQITLLGRTTSTNFFITETFGGVEIEWTTNLGPLGIHKKNWTFESGTSNEDIIEVIGIYLQEYQRKIFGQ